MIGDLVTAIFSSARMDSKQGIAIWIGLALALGGFFYWYSGLGLSANQLHNFELMENVSNIYHLENTLAKINEMKMDGVITKNDYWTIKNIYKNESFDTNY